MRSWFAAANRWDTVRTEAFSDGVFTIAITRGFLVIAVALVLTARGGSTSEPAN